MAKPTTALRTVPQPAPAAPSETAAKRDPGRPPGAKAKKGKPTLWSKWGKQTLRFVEMNKYLSAVAMAPGINLGTSILSDESLEEIAVLASTLQRMDADRVVVPVIPKPPKAPAFSIGDAVQVVKKFRAKYLETGLYTAGDLDLLAVVAVGKKGLLCQVDGTTASLQVFVRYAKHLEKR